MKVRYWLLGWILIVFASLSAFCFLVYKIDPFFHYHKPNLNSYFFRLYNQRSQNDGISKHFEYDAIITGTSMTENFRTSEADRLFGCNFIKVPYSGGSYKEINDNVTVALEHNDSIRVIIRCLDMSHFFDKWDSMRNDLGQYPTYLYDGNPFNDLKYLLNRDVVFGRAYQMTVDNNKQGFKPGIVSFDDYSRWQSAYTFGSKKVITSELSNDTVEQNNHLSESEKEIIKKNIDINVTNIADKYPDVDFYYFYPPYSAVSWNGWREQGYLLKWLEAEEYVTELIIPHHNIHLFSFNNRTDITTDLNNYKDGSHYASWVNSLILKWMKDGKYQLTKENYREYLKKEYDFYTTFDYTGLKGQEDYEADYYAAALLNEELTGVKPLDIFNDSDIDVVLNDAEIVSEKGGVLKCRGSLERDAKTENLDEYIRDKEFIGAKFKVNLDKGYNYLCFNGQKLFDQGQPTVYVYDEENSVVGKVEVDNTKLDNQIHQYAIDLSTISGNVTVVMNGGYVDNTGSQDSLYEFSNIFMY